MAIQFFCSACGHAIEVDDNVANQAVTCPYCRKVITAPPQTDLSNPPRPAVAGLSPMDLKPPPRRSILGWVALACIVISLVCNVYVSAAGKNLMKDMDATTTPPPVWQKTFNERLMQNPALLSLGVVGVCLLPVVGVTCAIIVLVIRARPRWPAITALSLLGAVILIACAGALFRQPMVSAGG